MVQRPFICQKIKANLISHVMTPLRLTHWCHMDYLMMSLLSFKALNVSVTLLSMEGQKALEFHQKYLHLCSEDERRSYCFRIAWGWEINDNVDFWVNYPLSVQIVFGAIASHLCRHCFHLSHDWTYSLNLGEQTMAMDSGSSIWYEQWVCRSTLDRKAVWVGWVCGAERQRHLNDYCRKTTVCLHCTDRQSRKLPFQSEYYFLIDPFKILHAIAYLWFISVI